MQCVATIPEKPGCCSVETAVRLTRHMLLAGKTLKIYQEICSTAGKNSERRDNLITRDGQHRKVEKQLKVMMVKLLKVLI